MKPRAPHRRPASVVVASLVATVLAGGPLPADQGIEPLVRGRVLLAMSIAAMGGAEAIAGLRSLAVESACTGPEGEFATTVESIRPDRVRVAQRLDGRRGDLRVIGDEVFRVDPDSGEWSPMPAAVRELGRGHEVQLLFLELDRRFSDHRLIGRQRWGAAECALVEMVDEAGRTAAVCFEPVSRLPVQLVFRTAEPEAPPIEITVRAWREVDELQLVDSFTLRQGDEVFTYDAVSIRPNAVDPALFERPAAP